MKLIAFILSLYVLALTAIPCVDEMQNKAFHKVELLQEKQNSHHHSDSDHCSPFCTCNCCASSVIFQVFQVQFRCFSLPLEQYTISSTEYFPSPIATIWQPPKIV